MDQGNTVDFGRDENVERSGALVSGGRDGLAGDGGVVNRLDGGERGAAVMNDGMALGDVDTPVMSDTMARSGVGKPVVESDLTMGERGDVVKVEMPATEVVQEEVVMNTDDANGRARREKRDKKILTGVLVVLLVAIVGLGIGVGMNNSRYDGVEISGNLVGEYAAVELSGSIRNRLGGDLGYDIEDAKRDFMNAINKSDNDTQVFVVLEYAKFLFDNGDKWQAIELLEEMKDKLVFGIYGKFNYYATLGSFYIEVGEKEKYNEIVRM